MVKKKIIVIGCPGSGKSTFCRRLHELTGIPLYHLDMLYFNADRTIVEREVFMERLNGVLERDSWIIDGNYLRTMQLRMGKCDAVFFLDYPADVCEQGILARRGKPRSDMPWTEMPQETDEELLQRVRNFQTESRPRIMELLSVRPEEMLVVDDLKPGYDMARSVGVPFAAAGWAYDVKEIRTFLQENCPLYFDTPDALYRYLFEPGVDEAEPAFRIS